MPLTKSEEWLIKHAWWVIGDDNPQCNNICRHSYLGKDCTILVFVDIRHNKSPFLYYLVISCWYKFRNNINAIDDWWRLIDKPCFIDEINISYCNNVFRHLYLFKDCTIHDILDVRYNKYPFDSVPINNIMWQIILISFAKITCLFYIWFETYLVKVYLLGNYLPNLWVINLQIRMKMKETRASWRSFIRWIVSIYLRFFANKYFKKRDIIFLEDIIDLSKYVIFCILHMETLSLMLRVSSKL